MITLVVHGTGVRQQGYDDTMAVICEQSPTGPTCRSLSGA
jgi:hypothetical protein